jgi:hypothetical protein
MLNPLRLTDAPIDVNWRSASPTPVAKPRRVSCPVYRMSRRSWIQMPRASVEAISTTATIAACAGSMPAYELVRMAD